MAWVVLVMFLKLKEFGGILFCSEESALLSIIRVGPYLFFLFVYRRYNENLLRVIIFSFLYFGLFQVKVQLLFKLVVDYIVINFWIVCWNFFHEIGFDCNCLKIVFVILVLKYVHIARRSRCFKRRDKS